MEESVEQLEKKKKNGMLAAGLNILLPGAGYMYCGRILLGIVVLPFTLLMVFTVPMVAITMWIVLIIDGFVCAGRYNKKLDEKIQGAMKTCPACAEKILPAAKVCKHCGHNLTSGMPSTPQSQPKVRTSVRTTKTAPQLSPPPPPAEETVECPYCNGGIVVSTLVQGDNQCPHCQQVFNVE